MIEARLDKIAIMPEKGSTVLYGVAEYGSDMLNIRAPFDFHTMDHNEFLEELRDKIAQGFDIPTYWVVMNNDVVLGKMMMWAERFRAMGLN